MLGVVNKLKGPIFVLLDFFRGSAELTEVIIAFFAAAVVIFVVFPIHECAHALMAKALGDNTAEREGRLTLNPISHVDPMGALLICLCNIGWARPVPVNIFNCRKVKIRTANALVAAAGPLANILLSYLFLVIFKVVVITVGIADTTVLYICSAIIQVITINLYLAVFNLVPIPPFDGYRIVQSFAPKKFTDFMERNQQIIYWVFFLLLMFDIASIPLSYAANGLMWVLDKASFFLGTFY